jgi:hypothetical protein
MKRAGCGAGWRGSGQGNIEFGDVDLQAEGGEAGDVGGEGRGIEIGAGKMQLQADAVDGDAAMLEVF